MVVLTVGKALGLVPVLKNLMDAKLPIKTAYKVARFARLADEQLKDFNELRIKLLKEYRLDKGDSTVLTQQQANEYNEKLSALLPAEIKIEAEKLSIEELEGVNISPSEILVLERNDFLEVR